MKSTHWDKMSSDYFNQINSPFSKGIRNPIFKRLKSIKNSKNKSVLEIGCGTGTLIPFLSKNFKKVVAIDISKQMIEKSKKESEGLKNVELKAMDALNIGRLKQEFDAIVCVNSLIMPNIVKINAILKKINKSLKKNGWLIGIFPSFDSTIHQALITYDKEYEKRKDRRKARIATSKILSFKRHDFVYGFVYANEAENRQKHYFRFELEYRLKKAGFLKIKIGKVHYPWSDFEDPEPSRFNDPIYEKMWDWAISARKM
ncbi:MAG: class I SAM-dependent methyltransferase [Candidatus Nanoarchaeia archaeon]|nr:class I SAM-dependent methyltransferase [Candidatus Nanoarchaeia archaeon]